MADELPEISRDIIADQPPSSPPGLEYYAPQPSAGMSEWLRQLPRPSWITVILLLLTGAAIYWFTADYAAWVAVRTFGGNLPYNSSPKTISNDGKQLLTILDDGKTIRIYNIASGKTISNLRGTFQVSTAWFSPDGSRVLSLGDGRVILWDVSTGQSLTSWQEISCDPTWYASPFSPDGRCLAVTYGRTTPPRLLRICDSHDGAVQVELADALFPVFSPDGRYLAAGVVGNPWTVWIWDTQNWQRVAELSSCDTGSGFIARLISWSPDSKTLAMAGYNNRVDLWDVVKNKTTVAFTTAGQVTGCRFTPDGRYLIALRDNHTEEMWDMITGKCVGTLTTHINYVGDAAVISPDGTRVVGGYGIKTFPAFKSLQKTDIGAHNVWLPDGRAFVSQMGGQPIKLIQLHRPEAAYGILWLPQFWLMLLGIAAAAFFVIRDFRRWRRNPPVLR